MRSVQGRPVILFHPDAECYFADFLFDISENGNDRASVERVSESKLALAITSRLPRPLQPSLIRRVSFRHPRSNNG